MHRKRKLPSFNTVAAGATSSVIIPKGPTYRSIILVYKNGSTPANKATLKADIKMIKLKINGKTRWEATGAEAIDYCQEYYGIGHRDGQIVIPLTRPWMKTMEAEENLAWGTRNIDTFELSVELASGATNPVLSAEAWITPESRDLGMIVEVHRFNFDTSVAGRFEISTLPRGNGDLVALHCKSAEISGLEVELNGTTMVDGDLETYLDTLVYNAERTLIADTVHVDALVNNRLADAYPVARVEDFRIKLDMDDGDSVPILMETLNAPLGQARAERS